MASPIPYRAVHVSGPRGTLEETLRVNASNIIDAGRKLSKQVGKLGLHGLYIPEHAELGWGNWFVVCNAGVNATYRLDGVIRLSFCWQNVPPARGVRNES